MSPELLFSNSELFAFHKPAGVPSAPHPNHPTQDTALTRVLALHPELAQVRGLRAWEPSLLHRLDTGTSGVLLFARTDAAFADLRAQWKSIRKVYRAWTLPQSLQASRVLQTLSKETPDPFVITGALAHSAKSAKRMLVQTPELTTEQFARMTRGRPLPAHTEILSVHNERPSPLGPAFDLEIAIATGVMHQIRAHLASLDLPIVGDAIYGVQRARADAGEDPAALQLHAWRVEIPGLPLIEAPLTRGLWTEKYPPH